MILTGRIIAKSFCANVIISTIVIFIVAIGFLLLGFINYLIPFIIIGLILLLFLFYSLNNIRYLYYTYELSNYGITIKNSHKSEVKKVSWDCILKIQECIYRINTGGRSYINVKYILISVYQNISEPTNVFRAIRNKNVICIPKTSEILDFFSIYLNTDIMKSINSDCNFESHLW